MDPKTTNSQRDAASTALKKPKWIRKRFNFWLQQGKSVKEAEKLSITPIKELKYPEVKALFGGKDKMDTPGVSKPASTRIRSTKETSNKPLKHQPHLTPGSIRVGLCAERPIGRDDAPLVMKEVGRLIDISPGDVSPRFERSSRKAGMILITCVDRESRDWLESQVSFLKPWPGAQFRLIKDTEIPKQRIGVAWIVDDDLEPKTILSRLHRQNRALGCLNWKVLNVKKQKKGQTVTFSFDEMSLNALRNKNFQVFLTTELIKIRVKNYNPDIEQVTVSKNCTERRNYEPSEQKPSLHPINYRSTLDNEDVLMEDQYGGPSRAFADYSTIYQNEEESEMTDWSIASSQMSAENEDYWQHDLPYYPSKARRSEFLNDRTETWPSSHAELNAHATHWSTERETQNSRQYGSISPHESYRSDLLSGHGDGLYTEDQQKLSKTFTQRETQNSRQYGSVSPRESYRFDLLSGHGDGLYRKDQQGLSKTFTQRETQNSRQYGSVSPRDYYRSDLLSGHGERYMGLSTAEHQNLPTTFSMEPKRSTSGHFENVSKFSSGNQHDCRSRSRENYDDWTRSSASYSKEMRKDLSIVWEPRSASPSRSAHRPSSPNRSRQYDCEGSRTGDSRRTKRPHHSTGRGYSRGSSKRGRSSYNPYQRR